MFMTVLAFWLVGANPGAERVKEGRLTVPLAQVYTKNVRHSLHQSGLVDGHPSLEIESSPQEWNRALLHLEGHLLSFVFVESRGLANLSSVFSGNDREILDYWKHTTYNGFPIVLAKILGVWTPTELMPYFAANTSKQARTMLFNFTYGSATRALRLGVAADPGMPQQTFTDVVADLRHQHPWYNSHW